MSFIRYRVLDMLTRTLVADSVRYQYECLYSKDPDPWKYTTSPYERNKYERTLAYILEHRRGRRSLLELGCSIGVFTRLCSPQFDKVTAVDFSRTALTYAAAHAKDCENVRFIRSDLRSLSLPEQYEVITCAAVLNNVPNRAQSRVLKRLADHLASNGIVVYVTGTTRKTDPWGEALASQYQTLRLEHVDDPQHPYKIVVFGKH